MVFMLNLYTISEFSREHCIAICAFLVPANLLATLLTAVFVVSRRQKAHIWRAASLASLPAIAMFFHVITWFAVGVVMAPTYILFTLGTVCLLINCWAAIHPQSMRQLILWVGQLLKQKLKLVRA